MGLWGFTQFKTPGGPTYRITSFSIGGYYGVLPFVRFHLGFEYEYNHALFKFFINDFYPLEKAKERSFSSGLYASGEFFIGNLSIQPTLGFYLPYPIPKKGIKYYIKVQTHYFPLGRNKKISPYFGFSLKAHAANAQYASLDLGINI